MMPATAFGRLACGRRLAGMIRFPQEPGGKLGGLVFDPLTSVVQGMKPTTDFAILEGVSRVEIPLGAFHYVSDDSHGRRPDASQIGDPPASFYQV